MRIIFEDRASDSPYVERIWRSRCEHAGTFISMALSQWQLVVWNDHISSYFTIRGPETKATPAFCPVHEEFMGIVLPHGVFMPHLAPDGMLDSAVTLPGASGATFRLDNSTWQLPTFDNADVFVSRLVRAGILVREPVVDAALRGECNDLSLRSTQRRFLRATGLTHSVIRQIDRARYATTLLQQGVSILDAVFQAGYFDQPHLTRSFQRYIGQTPAQVSGKGNLEQPAQLSFLYKTQPVP